MAKTALEAKRQADIAERTLTGVERPVVLVSIGNVIRDKPPPQDNTPGPRCTIQFPFVVGNYGRTAAIVISFQYGFPILDRNPGNLHDQKTTFRNEAGEFVLGINQGRGRESPSISLVGPGERANIWSGHKAFYFHGKIIYSDPTGRRREYAFAQKYTPHENNFVRFGGNEQNYDREIESTGE
jgi:hypothetical protein